MWFFALAAAAMVNRVVIFLAKHDNDEMYDECNSMSYKSKKGQYKTYIVNESLIVNSF
jgi:hypothetical protein